MKSAAVVVLSCLFALGSLAQTPRYYQPQVGDSVQIYRHHFGSDRHALGRGAIIQHLVPNLSRDGLVRMSLLAENVSSGEIINVHFSDPFNVSQDALAPKVGRINELSRRRTVNVYQIFGINDEGMSPAVGDELVLYWQKLAPGVHQQTRSLLMNDMARALRGDRQIRDSYFCEANNPGEFLSIAISKARDRADVNHAGIFQPLRQHFLEPMKVERFRIFSITMEAKR